MRRLWHWTDLKILRERLVSPQSTVETISNGQMKPTNSKKQGVRLGAGASVHGGITDAFNMTREFLRLFSTDSDCRRQSHVLRYVVGGLLMQQGANNQDPLAGVNIEDVFNAKQTLASRDLLEAAPFVAGWHPFVEQLDNVAVRPTVKNHLSTATQGVTPRSPETLIRC